MNITDLLTNGNVPAIATKCMVIREKDGDSVTRWQLTDPKSGFAMLIRMPVPPFHLCGYALVHSEKWEAALAANQVSDLGISYMGFGTRDISWREYGTKQSHLVPVKLTRDPMEDYWVGFDLFGSPRTPVPEAIDILMALCKMLRKAGVLYGVDSVI